MADSPAPDTKQQTMESNQPPPVAAADTGGPTEDPYNKAIGYLEKHNILQLFQNLTSDVIYHRPEDPLDYLIQEVQNLKQQREAGKADGK